MPKPTKGPRLGGWSLTSQKALLANLATSLSAPGRIKTTKPKARALRPYAEKLITHTQKAPLHNRRKVVETRRRGIIHVLFAMAASRQPQRSATPVLRVKPAGSSPRAILGWFAGPRGPAGPTAHAARARQRRSPPPPPRRPP